MNKRINKSNRFENEDNNTINSNADKILEKLNHQIVFSYKYVKLNKKFNLKGCSERYFLRLIEVLFSLGSMHVDEFKFKYSKQLSNHFIDWDECTEDSFDLKDEKIAELPYQFGLNNKDLGRVHGFFIENTFYIRWFDPKHRLYKLDENQKDKGYDKEHRELLKKQFIDNDQEWAADHISQLTKQYEEEIKSHKLDNTELLKDLLEKEELIQEVKENICEECEVRIFS
jgi:hypothetical protein